MTTSNTKRWIKIPDAGSKPGTGLWRDYDEMSHEWGKSKSEAEVQWQALQVSKYLPTQISKEKPSDKEMGVQESTVAGVVSTRLEGHVPQ